MDKRIQENKESTSSVGHVSWEAEKNSLLGEIRALKDMLKDSVMKSVNVDSMNSRMRESPEKERDTSMKEIRTILEAEKSSLLLEVSSLKKLLVESTEAAKFQERLRLEEQRNSSVLKELFDVEKKSILGEIRSLRESEAEGKEKMNQVRVLEDQLALVKGSLETERESHLRTMNHWNKEHEEMTNELRTELRRQVEQIERQQRVLEERSNVIAEKEAEIRQLRSDFESHAKDFEESYKYQINQEKDTLSKVRAVNETLKEELRENKDRLEHQTAEWKTSMESAVVSEHQIREHKNTIYRLEGRVRELQHDLENSKAENVKWEGIYKDAELAVREKEYEVQKLRQDLKELSQIKHEQEQLGVTMKKSLENDKSSLLAELDSLKQKLHEVAVQESPSSSYDPSLFGSGAVQTFPPSNSESGAFRDVGPSTGIRSEQHRYLITIHQAFSLSLQNSIQEALLLLVEGSEVSKRCKSAIQLLINGNSSSGASVTVSSRAMQMLNQSQEQNDIVLESLKKVSERVKDIQKSSYETDRSVMSGSILTSRESALQEFSKHNVELSQTVMKQNMMISEYRMKISKLEHSEGENDGVVHKEYKQLLLTKSLEIERLKNDIRAFEKQNSSSSDSFSIGRATQPADSERVQSRQLVADVNLLKASLRRSLNFRKALIYQKKYLLLLLGGYQQTYDNTLAYLSRIGEGSTILGDKRKPKDRTRNAPSLNTKKPQNRFRVAAMAVRAAMRMRILARNWQTETDRCRLLLQSAAVPHVKKANNQPVNNSGGLVGKSDVPATRRPLPAAASSHHHRTSSYRHAKEPPSSYYSRLGRDSEEDGEEHLYDLSGNRHHRLLTHMSSNGGYSESLDRAMKRLGQHSRR